MNDVKTWADIDASPLLQLPPEQRKKLHDANDERFRTFWAECFLTAQAPGRRGGMEQRGFLRCVSGCV